MRALRVIPSKPEPQAPVRYTLRLPVIFYWGDQMKQVAGGFTKDIGSHEAFIISDDCPPIGGAVRLEVLVPLPDSLPGTLRVECTGKVTHVVREHGYTGFLFHGRFYEGKIRSDRPHSASKDVKRRNDLDGD